MGDYLSTLIQRLYQPADTIQPRLSARFEASQAIGDRGVGAAQPAHLTLAEEALPSAAAVDWAAAAPRPEPATEPLSRLPMTPVAQTRARPLLAAPELTERADAENVAQDIRRQSRRIRNTRNTVSTPAEPVASAEQFPAQAGQRPASSVLEVARPAPAAGLSRAENFSTVKPATSISLAARDEGEQAAASNSGNLQFNPLRPRREPSDQATLAQRPDQASTAGEADQPTSLPTVRQGKGIVPTRIARSQERPPTQQASQPVPHQPPLIRVTIGRIEVRASLPAKATATHQPPANRPVAEPVRPSLSLNDYLKQRGGRS